jgi:hypothetical protein
MRNSIKPLMFSLWVKNSAGEGWILNDEEYSHTDTQADSMFEWGHVFEVMDYIVQFVDAHSEFRIVERPI